MAEGEASPAESFEGAARGWRFVLQHFGIIAAVAPILVASVRLISVTNYDQAKMLTLLHYSDVLRLVIATVLPTLPTVLVVTAMVAEGWIFSHGQAARNRGALGFLSSAVIFIGMMSAILVPLFNLVVLVALVLVLYLMEKRFQRRRVKRGIPYREWDPWLQVAVPLATALVLPVIYNSDVWLSPETITLRDKQPMVGYVVGTDEDFTVLLREDDRTISFVPTKEIESRSICNVGNKRNSRPLAAWLAESRDDVRSPRCPGQSAPK